MSESQKCHSFWDGGSTAQVLLLTQRRKLPDYTSTAVPSLLYILLLSYWTYIVVSLESL